MPPPWGEAIAATVTAEGTPPMRQEIATAAEVFAAAAGACLTVTVPTPPGRQALPSPRETWGRCPKVQRTSPPSFCPARPPARVSSFTAFRPEANGWMIDCIEIAVGVSKEDKRCPEVKSVSEGGSGVTVLHDARFPQLEPAN